MDGFEGLAPELNGHILYGQPIATLTFDGKPGTWDYILAHCESTFQLRPRKFSDPTIKSAYLAMRFRGKALSWLAQQRHADKTILSDYNAFTIKVIHSFNLTDKRKRVADESRLAMLTRTGRAPKGRKAKG